MNYLWVLNVFRYKVIKASVGRNHTVVVTDDGKSFSFGHNKHGQLGTGSLRNGMYLWFIFNSLTSVVHQIHVLQTNHSVFGKVWVYLLRGWLILFW